MDQEAITSVSLTDVVIVESVKFSSKLAYNTTLGHYIGYVYVSSFFLMFFFSYVSSLCHFVEEL